MAKCCSLNRLQHLQPVITTPVCFDPEMNQCKQGRGLKPVNEGDTAIQENAAGYQAAWEEVIRQPSTAEPVFVFEFGPFRLPPDIKDEICPTYLGLRTSLFDEVVRQLTRRIRDSHACVRPLIQAVLFLWCAKYGKGADVVKTIPHLKAHVIKHGTALTRIPVAKYSKRLVSLGLYRFATDLLEFYADAVEPEIDDDDDDDDEPGPITLEAGLDYL